MDLNLIFPTPIWANTLIPDLFKVGYGVTDFTDFCYKQRSLDPDGVYQSNTGGWEMAHSSFDEFPEFENFKSILNTKFKNVFEQYGYDIKNKYDVQISYFWANINNVGHSNTTHAHLQSFLSGVFYIKVPENSGRICFIRDYKESSLISQYGNPTQNELNFSSYAYQPEEGQLIIFPSWLPHRVEPNQSNDERISMAFDAKLVAKVID
jgi:uncharacterized protein (TIGR02466 family)